jgi:taurine dioxygenase
MRFRRLHESLGAEVLDFDLRAPTSANDVEALRHAFDEHQLLLFRGGSPVSPERQMEITGWLGPLVDDLGDGRRWSTLTNADDAGRIRLRFHSDFTYTEAPIRGISLHALAIPPGGATTSFVSGVRAWATLPSGRQEVLAGMTVRHAHVSSISPELPRFVAHHPLRLSHPRTGEPVLFVTEHHADRIEELDEDESDRVLAELFAHLYARERVYVHAWQLYDLVLWDNLAIQHAREDEAAVADGERTFQRVALNDRSYQELIARARAAEARG